MEMTVRVSEFDVADAIRKGDLSLGIVLAAVAKRLEHEAVGHDVITRPAAGYIRGLCDPDATRAMLRDLLTQSERPDTERPARAAG